MPNLYPELLEGTITSSSDPSGEDIGSYLVANKKTKFIGPAKLAKDIRIEKDNKIRRQGTTTTIDPSIDTNYDPEELGKKEEEDTVTYAILSSQ